MTSPAGGPEREDLRSSLVRTLHRRSIANGSITLPAVPALLEEYVSTCLLTFRALGVEFDANQIEHLRTTLADQIAQAFVQSPRSNIVITYDSPVGQLVNYHVQPQWTSVEKTYDAWVATREPPYFGSEPDARVWTIAAQFTDPRECAVLDIGAGVGRNSLPLARRGHPVDALEVSGNFADVLREQARTQSLGIRVIQRDLFAARDYLPGDYGLIIVSEVATDFRSVEDLRFLFELASSALTDEGYLVVNCFLARDDYEPDDAARQVGQQTYSSIFTREELAVATAGLPIELIDDTSVYDYEHANLPSESWPPTGWYEGWVLGQDVFPVNRPDIPIELRWLVYRRMSSAEKES